MSVLAAQGFRCYGQCELRLFWSNSAKKTVGTTNSNLPTSRERKEMTKISYGTTIRKTVYRDLLRVPFLFLLLTDGDQLFQ